MSRSALVTGAGGVLGRPIAHELQERGFDVVLHRGRGDGDLSEPGPAHAALRIPNLSTVINAAGLTYGSGDGLWKANAIIPLRLAEALEASASTARLIVLSSAAVYGLSDTAGHRFTENDVVRPGSDYALSKVAAERIAQAIHPSTVAARIFNLLVGRGETDPRSLLGRVRKGFDAGDTEPVGASDVRDWITPAAVARAIVALALADDPPPIMNICSGSAKSTAEVLGHSARRPAQSFSIGDPSAMERVLGAPVETTPAPVGSNDEAAGSPDQTMR